MGRWDSQSPQEAETPATWRQVLKLMGFVCGQSSWEGRRERQVGLAGCSQASMWVPLLGLVALDKPLSGGSDSIGGTPGETKD